MKSGRRWRRPAALMSAFAATIMGLGAVGQVLAAPEAQAFSAPTWNGSTGPGGAAFTSDSPGIDMAGARWTQSPTGNVTSGTLTAPNTNALYGARGDVNPQPIDTINTGTAAGTTVFTLGTPGDNGSTMAIDSGTVSGNTGFYTWWWNGNPAPGLPNTHPIYYWDSTVSTTAPTAVYDVPLPSYFHDSGIYAYYSGGVINQKTGQLLLGQGECTGINASARMAVFDPKTGYTYYSGKLQYATASDNLWQGTGDACPGTGYIGSGAAIAPNGDMFVVVNGTAVAIPATDPRNPTGQNIPAGTSVSFLVKIHPSLTTDPWTYSVVKLLWDGGTPVTGFFGNYHYGTAFLNGYLYVSSTTNLHKVNPLTGVVTRVGTTPATYFDLASAQTAPTISGTVYQDTTGSGTFSTTNTPAPNQTVAIYELGGPSNYTTPMLLGTQVTDGNGNYTFLVPDVGSGVKYYLRVVQPVLGTAANPVNAVVTSAAALTDTYSGTSNDASITCGDGSTIAGGAGSLNGSKCQGVGANGTSQSAPLGTPNVTTLNTATDGIVFGVVNMNTSWAESQIDFTLSSATLSFGDAAAGPATTPAGAPVHNNSALQPVQLGPSAPGAGAQTAPSTTDNHATDDGVTITSKLPDGQGGFTSTQISLKGTVMAATNTYNSLTANVVANNGYPCSGIQPCYVSAWTTGTGASSNTWTSTPKWPAGAPTSTGAGNLTAPFQFQTSGSVGATPATVQMRFDASTVQQTSATNSGGTYQSTGAAPNWVTTGEIEDYTFQVADAVYRPAAQTTAGSDTGFVVGPTTTSTIPGTVTTAPAYGPAQGVGTAAVTVNVKPPADGKYYLSAVNIYDTETGALITNGNIPLTGTLTSAGGTFQYTPALGSDVTILATFALAPNNCTITGPTSTTLVNANATVTVKCVDSANANVPGAVVTFTSTPATTGTSTWVPTGMDHCTTGTDGSCTVQLTSGDQATFNVGATTPGASGPVTAKTGGTTGNTTVPVQFVAGAVVPGSSTITIDNATYVLVGTPTSTPPGGTHTITVTLKDGSGNTVLVDHKADLTWNLPAGVSASAWTFNATTGVYTATLTSTTAGTLPVSVNYSGSKVGSSQPDTGTVMANYKPGAPEPGPFPCPADPTNPGVVTYGGSQLILGTSPVKIPATSSVQALVEDKYCNKIVSSTVVFSKDSTTATLTPAGSQTTDSTGKTPAVVVADTKKETVNLGATATDPANPAAPPSLVPYWTMNGSTPTTPTNTGPITFTAGDPVITCDTGVSPCSNLTVQTPVDVNAQSTVTATITDAKGNLVADGTPVTFTVPTTTTGMFIDPANAANKVQTITVNTVNGVAQLKLTDAHAETVPVTATIAAGAVKPSPVNVVFQPTDVDPLNSSFTCSPSPALNDAAYTNYPVANNVDKYTCTVTLRDTASDLLPGLASSVHVTDSSADVTITTPVDNGDGTYTVYLTSKVAQSTATASAAYNTSAIGTAKNTPFQPGPASNGPFTCNPGMTPGGLTVTPVMATPLTGVSVDDTTTATATAKLTDQFCNPIPNKPLTITANGSIAGTGTVKLTYGTLAPAASVTQNTGTDGTVFVKVSDVTAETVSINATAAALVGVTPPNPNPTGLLVGSPQQILFTSGGGSITCDTGIPASSCTNLTVTPTPVNSTTPGTGVSVDAAPGGATATVLVTDKHGNKLANQTVTFSSTGSATFVSATGTHAATTTAVTDSNGLATVWVVDYKAEKVGISATINTPAETVPGSPQPLLFVPGDPVVTPCVPTPGAAPQTGTKVTADPYDNGTVLANVPVTTGSSIVTVLVYDDKCNAVPDVTVTFGNNGSSILTPTSAAPVNTTAKTATTDANGLAKATLTDSKAETVTVTASITQGNITGVPSPLKVTFAPGGPSNTCTDPGVTCTNLTVTPTPATPLTGVSVEAAPGTATATALITDADGNPLANQTVTFTSTGDATFLTATGAHTATTTAVTGGDGKATVWVVDKTAETVGISAAVTGINAITGSPQQIKFVPGVPSVGPFTCKTGQDGTNMQASPHDAAGAPANVTVSTGKSVVTVLVTDQYCNPIPGITVTAQNTSTSGNSTLTPDPNWVTNDNGRVTAYLTDTTAETVTLSAKIPINGVATTVPVKPASPLTVTFQPGGPSNTCLTGTVCTNLAVVPATTSSTSGVSVDDPAGTAKAIATITDANGNLLANQIVTFTADSGTAKFLNPANGAATTTATTNAQGQATVWVTDTKVEEVKVSAGVTGLTPIAGSPKSIWFTPGKPDPGPNFPKCTDGRPGTNMTASPYDQPGVPANVSVAGGNSTVTVLVTDDYCNPVPGVVVTVNKTGAAVLTPTTNWVTNDQGVVTARLTDSTAQTVTLTATIPTDASLTSPVPVKPSAPLTVTFAPGGPANTCLSGTVCTNLTVTPAPATPLTPVLVTAPAGSATATATITDAQGNLLQNIPVTFSAGTSSTARFVNPANNAPVTTLPTDANGQVTVWVIDSKAETVQVSAGTSNISAITGSPQPILFQAGAPSNTCTTPGIVCTNLSVTPTPATPLTGVSVDAPNGSATATATITDANGNLLSGVQVTFTSGTSTTAKFLDPVDGHQVTSMTTDANGKATVWVFDSKAETVQVSANTATLTPITASPQPIKFVAGPPDPGPLFPKCQTGQKGTNLSASPADGATPANLMVSTGTSTVTALVTDDYCNPVAGVPVTFGPVSNGTLTLGTSGGVTDANGLATATLSDKTAETVTLSATINAKGNPVAQMPKNPDPLTVTFTAGPPSNTCIAGVVCTNLTVTPAPATPLTGVSVDAAPGAATATATITDAQGNRLPNIDVTFTSTGDAKFVDTTAAHNPITGSVKTNAQGQVTVDVIDNTAETVQISAATPTIPAINGSQAPILFVAGDPSVGPFTCKTGQKGTNLSANPYDAPGAPANVGVDGGNSLVTALVTDDKCNPVQGVQVTFNKTGNAVLTPGASGGITGADGKATASLTDSTAQTVTLTATIPIPGNSAASVPASPSAPLTVTFIPGGPANTCKAGVPPASCTNLTVTPVPANSTTPGTGVSVDAAPGGATATALITDADGNPLGNQTVTFRSTGDATFVTATGAHTATTTAVTDPITGKATVWVVDHTAETVFISAGVATINSITGSPQPIKFVPGNPDPGPNFPKCQPGQVGTNLSASPADVQSPAFSPTNLTVNGGISTVTAYVTDDYCNPVAGVTVTFTKTGSASLVPVNGGVTGNDGNATALLTDKVAEKVTLTASMPAGNIVATPAPLTVTFAAGGPVNTCAPDAPRCTLLTVTPVVTTPLTGVKVTDPNGSATATATITDYQGNLLSGVEVTFTQSGNAQFLDPANGLPVSKLTTGTNGKATVWVVDMVAQQVDITATTGATGPIRGSTQPILFVAGAPWNGPTFNCTDPANNGTHLSVTPAVTSPLTGVKVDSTPGTASATMLVTDIDCNPIEGARVTFAQNGSAKFTDPTTGLVITGTVLTGANGKVTLNVIDTKAEVISVSATDDVSTPAVPGSPKQIQFTAGNPDPGPDFPKCTQAQIDSGMYTHLYADKFDASPTAPINLSVNGAKSVVSAIVTDEFCNPVPNVMVTFGKDSTVAVLATPATPPVATNTAMTNGNGIATLNLTDTKAETVTLTSSITQGNMVTTPSPLKVTFQAGGPAKTCDAGVPPSSCTRLEVVPATTATTVSVDDPKGTAKVIATITDSKGNLLKDIPVSIAASTTTAKFFVPATGAEITPVAGAVTAQTDANGQVTLWVTESAAGTDNFSASTTTTGLIDTKPIKFVAGGGTVGPFDCTKAQMNAHQYTHLEADPADGTTPANVLTITGTSTVRALVTDDKCNPVQGAVVTINKTGSATLTPSTPQTTGQDGWVTVTLKDPTAETVTLTATIPPDATHPTAQQMITIQPGSTTAAPLKVTFTNVVDCTTVPGHCVDPTQDPYISYTNSTFVVTPAGQSATTEPTWKLANGKDYYTGTLVAKDADGHLLDGLSPSVMKFAVGTQATACTGGANVICPTTPVVQSNMAGVVGAITAVGGGTGQYTVKYTSTTASKPAVPSTMFTATVWVNDAWSPIGTTVGGVIQPTVLNILFTDHIDCTTTPTLPECQPDLTKSYLTVTGPAPALTVPDLNDKTTWQSAGQPGGTSGYTATFTAINSDGIRIMGLDPATTMVLTPSSTNITKTPAVMAPVGDGTSGQYSTTLTTKVAASDYTVSFKYKNQTVFALDGGAVSTTKSALPIPFKAGPPKPGPFGPCDDGRPGSHVEVAPASLTVGGTATAKALVTDEFCNPVEGAWVGFAPDGAATVSPTVAQTDSKGIATAQVTDKAAQTVMVTATILQNRTDTSGQPDGTAQVIFKAVPIVVSTGGSAASFPFGAIIGSGLAILAGLWLAIKRRTAIMTGR